MINPESTLHPSSNLEHEQNQELEPLNSNKIYDKKAVLPAYYGDLLGTGNYIVTIGLGTPKKELSLVFDTASDLTWTRCEPCAVMCYQQQDPIFNPSTSGSYRNVSCTSAACSDATGIRLDCDTGTCTYGLMYGDMSYSQRFLSEDNLTITPTNVFPRFLFGCGQNNQGEFGTTAGIIGLGRQSLSIISQTAHTYGKYFAYCLPPTSSTAGHLTLGKVGLPRNVKFTPFNRTRGTRYYFIVIVAISVGGVQLPIRQSVFKTAGSFIDSGTIITRLPPDAYSEMRASFRELMDMYPRAPAYSILDTCYDLSGYASVTIPTISFTFSGNVTIDLDPSGILFFNDGSRSSCLAFAGNRDATDITIFGNAQQKTMEVVYDVAGGNLGFAPHGC